MHSLIVGETGCGKTTLLKKKILEDLAEGRGFLLVDPHGDLAEWVKKQHLFRKRRHWYFDYDHESVNLFDGAGDKEQKTNAIIEIFRDLYKGSFLHRSEEILRWATMAVLHLKRANILWLDDFLGDKRVRAKILKRVKDKAVHAFFEQYDEQWREAFRVEATAPLRNKLGAFKTPRMRRIVASSTIKFRTAMDEGWYVVANISKGRFGEVQSQMLGNVILLKTFMAALSRVDTPFKDRLPFNIYVDEFHNFQAIKLDTMFSEGRKFRQAYTVATQTLNFDMADTLTSNCSSKYIFRCGAKTAAYMATQTGYMPEDGFGTQGAVSPRQILNLPNFNYYLRTIEDGTPTSARPFKLDLI